MDHTVSPDNPYAAPVAAVADEAPREHALAGRGIRLAAALLDGLFASLVVVPAFVALPFIGANGGQLEMNAAVITGIAAVVLLGIALVVANCILLERNGQTIAKKLLGIRVVRRDGSRCGLARIFFARYLPVTLLSAIPFIGSLVGLADALLIFRDDRRCLHDEIADTIVVTA